jgi:hypothetical protein
MTTVQIRRYELLPGMMDDFVAWFPRLVPVREAHGFTVLFAYADRERNEFVWAVSHEDDFEAAVARYNESPERAAVFEGQPKRVGAMHVGLVEPVVPAAG